MRSSQESTWRKVSRSFAKTGVSAGKFGKIPAILLVGMKRAVAADITLRNRTWPTITSVGMGSTVKLFSANFVTQLALLKLTKERSR